MSKFNEHDVVRTICPITSDDVKIATGKIGTVVSVYGADVDVCSVEIDNAVHTLPDEAFEKVE